MKLESEGIIVELAPFGERDGIGRVFTRDFGVMCGIFKAGQIARAKPLVGQFGHVSWNARLEAQLGAFHFESVRNLIAPLFSKAEAMALAGACFSLIAAFLPEREAYPKVYNDTMRLLDPRLRGDDGRSMARGYLEWEISLLAELGYGLSLDRCGNCGGSADLAYLSPKSGRAICGACGGPYKDRLFGLPVDLAATGHFLARAGDVPAAREFIGRTDFGRAAAPPLRGSPQ